MTAEIKKEEDLKRWDVILFLEERANWRHISKQKVISEKLVKRIKSSWLLRTKSLEVVKEALRNKLKEQMEEYIEREAAPFTS